MRLSCLVFVSYPAINGHWARILGERGGLRSAGRKRGTNWGNYGTAVKWLSLMHYLMTD